MKRCLTRLQQLKTEFVSLSSVTRTLTLICIPRNTHMLYANSEGSAQFLRICRFKNSADYVSFLVIWAH